MTTRRTLVPIVALWALAAVVAGCGDDAGSVTFGEGEIPGSVPGDFPVPAGAVVGSTLVDGVNHRTEFRFNVGQGSTAVIQFYTVSLVSAGYVVDRSEGDLTLWSIEFSRDTLRGSVLVQPAGAEVTGVVVSINRS